MGESETDWMNKLYCLPEQFGNFVQKQPKDREIHRLCLVSSAAANKWVLQLKGTSTDDDGLEHRISSTGRKK